MPFISVLLFALALVMLGLLILILNSRPFSRKKSYELHKPPPVTVPKVYTETAFLLQKIDERRRIMDEYRHTRITDEYFELVFELQNGEMLRISCSKTAYHDMPFRKTGTLTYSDGRLMRFRTTEQVISDEYH